MSEEIEEIENELSVLLDEKINLEEKLNDINKSINNVMIDICQIKFGVFEGCLVTDRKGEEYKVTRVKPFSVNTTPWIEGVAKKKDGNWSKRVVNIYGDWKVKP
jgi:hypothetical protein